MTKILKTILWTKFVLNVFFCIQMQATSIITGADTPIRFLWHGAVALIACGFLGVIYAIEDADQLEKVGRFLRKQL